MILGTMGAATTNRKAERGCLATDVEMAPLKKNERDWESKEACYADILSPLEKSLIITLHLPLKLGP